MKKKTKTKRRKKKMNTGGFEVIEKRFYSNVRKTNACWIWNGSKHLNGYGRFGVNKLRISAHRFSYMINKGHIDEGMFIHHECNRKDCVNPKHLYLVTPKQNTQIYYNGYGW
jgi:hypothetical protein